MRILADQKEFAQAVSHVTRILDRDNPIIRLQTDDGIVTVSASARGTWSTSRVNATIILPGDVSVNGFWLNTLANAMPQGETDVESREDGMLALNGGDTSLRMRVSATVDVPDCPQSPDQLFTVDANDWERLCRSVIHATGNDSTQPILSAIRFTGSMTDGTLTSTATNRYVIGQRTISVPNMLDGQWLASAEWVKRNMRNIHQIGFTDRTLTVATERDTDTIVLMDGEYPHVDSLWWDESLMNSTITVNRSELAATARMLKSVCFDTRLNIIPLILDEHNGMLRIRYAGAGDDMDSMGARLLSATIEGEPVLRVNADYLIGVLDAMDAEQISIHTAEGKPTFLFDQDDHQVRQLVMSVQQH